MHATLTVTVALCGLLTVDGASMAAVGSPEGSLTSSTSASGSGTSGWEVSVFYESSNCSGTPVELLAGPECSSSEEDASECAVADSYGSASGFLDVPELGTTSVCVSDLSSYTDKLFGDQAYVRIDAYESSDCAELDSTTVFIVDGLCHAQILGDAITKEPVVLAKEATVSANGAVAVLYYNTSDCSSEPYYTLKYTEAQLAGGQCNNGSIAYTNGGATATGSTSTNSTAGSDDIDGASTLSMRTVVVLVAACTAFFT